MALSCCKKFVVLRGVTSNNNGDFYCINCFHSYRKEKLIKHENVCKNHGCCYIEIPKEAENMKVPFLIYADLESLFEKMSIYQNNPEKLSTTKINKHKPSGYSLFTKCSFDSAKNRLL